MILHEFTIQDGDITASYEQNIEKLAPEDLSTARELIEGSSDQSLSHERFGWHFPFVIHVGLPVSSNLPQAVELNGTPSRFFSFYDQKEMPPSFPPGYRPPKYFFWQHPKQINLVLPAEASEDAKRQLQIFLNPSLREAIKTFDKTATGKWQQMLYNPSPEMNQLVERLWQQRPFLAMTVLDSPGELFLDRMRYVSTCVATAMLLRWRESNG